MQAFNKNKNAFHRTYLEDGKRTDQDLSFELKTENWPAKQMNTRKFWAKLTKAHVVWVDRSSNVNNHCVYSIVKCNYY